jgi:dihydrofolate reductase
MKVILIAAVSADGKIAQTPGQKSLDWTSKEDLKFFVAKTKEIGVVIMGNTTFKTIGKGLPGRRLIVMTARPDGQTPVEGVEFTEKPPKALLEQLAEEGLSQVALAGGSRVYSEYLEQGFVTDLFLTIEPVLFGNGTPLAVGFDRINLELVETTKLNDQAVLMHYRVRK